MPKFGVIFWCDFCRFTPQHAHASKAGIPETSVAATGFSWIERCSQKSRETHGMQGVRSSSLLGSIEESQARPGFFCFRVFNRLAAGHAQLHLFIEALY